MQRLLIIILSCLMLTACSSEPTSPEQKVRQTLSAMETAAEERSKPDFARYISDDYSDPRGNNKDAVKGLLQYLFIRNQKIKIFTLIRSIEIQAAAMASRDIDLSQEANRLKADTQRFWITLKPNKNNDTWIVQSASWQHGW